MEISSTTRESRKFLTTGKLCSDYRICTVRHLFSNYRFACYTQAAWVIFGRLGKKKRRQLPDCIGIAFFPQQYFCIVSSLLQSSVLLNISLGMPSKTNKPKSPWQLH